MPVITYQSLYQSLLYFKGVNFKREDFLVSEKIQELSQDFFYKLDIFNYFLLFTNTLKIVTIK